jgi:hypothetical protein
MNPVKYLATRLRQSTTHVVMAKFPFLIALEARLIIGSPWSKLAGAIDLTELRLQQLQLSGSGHSLDAIVCPQLAIDAVDMSLNRAYYDEEFFGDLSVLKPSRH